MPHYEARGLLDQKLRMDSSYGLATVLFNTATIAHRTSECSQTFGAKGLNQYYLLTNWLAYLYGRIQSPRLDVMPDRREGITRAAGFVFACIDTQAS